jgi:hypothetical protein
VPSLSVCVSLSLTHTVALIPLALHARVCLPPRRRSWAPYH